MAKNQEALFGDIFGELNKTAQGGQVSRPSEPDIQKNEPKVEENTLQGKLAKQGKQGKQKKEYDYGTKRTFPIPDELWNDALIVMKVMDLTQVAFINSLIQRAVDENRETIETVKKMRGDK